MVMVGVGVVVGGEEWMWVWVVWLEGLEEEEAGKVVAWDRCVVRRKSWVRFGFGWRVGCACDVWEMSCGTEAEEGEQ